MIRTATLGFPQLGPQLEYKKSLRAFLSQDITENKLFKSGHDIRVSALKMQNDAKIDIIPCNDFSWHDEVWDVSLMIGNIPSRYYWEGGEVPTEIYFAPSKGHKKDKFEVPGMEIRPYFTSRAYYTVPEFQDGIHFIQSDNKIIHHYIESKTEVENARPAILGPVSYMLLGKVYDSEDEKFTQIDVEKTLLEIIDVYSKVFTNLKRVNAKHVQLNEPCLSTNLPIAHQNLFSLAYKKLKELSQDMEIMVFTGFTDIGHNEDLVLSLPVDCIHINVMNMSDDRIEKILQKAQGKEISLGLVSGDNVFISNLNYCVEIAKKFLDRGYKIQIAPTCPLAFCPLDLHSEKNIPTELKPYVSFAVQKLDELTIIKNALNGDKNAINTADKITKLHNELYEKINAISLPTLDQYSRTDKSKRSEKQKKDMNLSIFPMTTIGTFGQISQKSTAYANDKLESFLKRQVDYGFDILSSGEFDRKGTEFDYFVQFFSGSILNTNNAYVKTYFNALEKFPIVFGSFTLNDDKAKEMITQESETVSIAASMNKIIKYRLIGPITAMHRSFCFEKDSRKDIYLGLFSGVCKKIAKTAIDNGFGALQLDENNILSETHSSLESPSNLVKIENFVKNVYAKIKDNVPVHLYFENANVIPYIDDFSNLDPDLIIFESFRSTHDIIKNISSYKYDGDIAIGFYDPTSHYTPSVKDIHAALKFAIRAFDLDKLWVSYDCHFKDFPSNLDQSMKNLKESVLLCREKFSKFD